MRKEKAGHGKKSKNELHTVCQTIKELPSGCIYYIKHMLRKQGMELFNLSPELYMLMGSSQSQATVAVHSISLQCCERSCVSSSG